MHRTFPCVAVRGDTIGSAHVECAALDGDHVGLEAGKHIAGLHLAQHDVNHIVDIGNVHLAVAGHIARGHQSVTGCLA